MGFPRWNTPRRAGAGCVFAPLLVASLLAAHGCADTATRFTASLRDLEDGLATLPPGSEASAIYPVTPGAEATLVFLPTAERGDAGSLRAGGVAGDLARRIAHELADLPPRTQPLLVVAQSGRLRFTSSFAEVADVTDVVSGRCRGRCRVTLRVAGPGVRPRVVRVG